MSIAITKPLMEMIAHSRQDSGATLSFYISKQPGSEQLLETVLPQETQLNLTMKNTGQLQITSASFTIRAAIENFDNQLGS